MTSSFYNFFLFLFWDVRTDVLCLEMDRVAERFFGTQTGQCSGERTVTRANFLYLDTDGT